MKIVSTAIEPGRRSRASVEFVVRLTLEGPASGCEVTGSVVGPHAAGFTTVEVAYPMVMAEMREASDNALSLKCVIPEPSLWTREAPFSYAWSIDVEVSGEVTDSRSGALAFPDPG